MGGRLRLYAGTGRPVYDSQGDPADREVERIKSEYNAGVAMYYDPGAGIVRGQVNLHRRGPEQFVAAYTSDGDEDLLESFTSAVERAADERGWSIQDGVGGNQAVFDAFAGGVALDPDGFERIRRQLAEHALTLDRLRDELAGDTPVDLLVPDYETAARTLAFLRAELGDTYAIAITESTDVPTIQSGDLWIRPSGRVDAVSPGPDLRDRLRRERAESTASNLEQALTDLADAISAHDVPPAAGVAAVLNARNVDERFGLALGHPAAPPAWRRQAVRWFVGVAPPATVVGVGLAVIRPWGVDPLSAPGSASPWSLLALGVLALVVGVVAWTIGDRVTVPGIRPLSIPDSNDAVDRNDLAREVGSTADEVIETLDRLDGTTDADAFRDRVSSVLGEHGVTVERPSDRSRPGRAGIAAGIIAGVAVGVVGFLLVSLVAPAAIDAVGSNGSATLSVALAVGGPGSSGRSY